MAGTDGTGAGTAKKNAGYATEESPLIWLK
jgi:hypothetical protein